MLSRRVVIIALSTVVLLSAVLPVAAASFGDVPDSNEFVADIDWLVWP